MSNSLSNFNQLGLKLDVYLLGFNKLNFDKDQKIFVSKTEKEILIITLHVRTLWVIAI